MIILTVASYIIMILIINNLTNRFLLEGKLIEVAWTIAPAIIIVFIAILSLRLSYLIDEINNPVVTLTTTGHQWYWSYEYSGFLKVEFDSYIIPQNEIDINNLPLLDVVVLSILILHYNMYYFAL